MNEKETALTKLSYINKDFASIYPDLLDFVKEITNRWDPSASNESDPGVVLLKVGALLADHLNYNIDKNILEAFLPSATQEESVRRIAEFGGYVPAYYRSAVGKVTLSYNPDSTASFNSFNIPAFSLVISNDDGSITYTQISNIEVNGANVPTTGEFMEGTVQRLAVDSDVITLANLDDFRRLYFPTQYVAENGVYIYNVLNGTKSSDFWKKTNYIYTQPVGTKCYKIDYDSDKGLPYIEFPSDIANLIEDGLSIFYISTSGSYGNVSANELNTVVSINPSNLEAAAQDIVNHVDAFTLSNSSSITNGRDPENIADIYNSYKKVVGTFDTLVSLQDYSNAIRTAEDTYGQKYISNGLVTDRRVDYNNSINVITSKLTGTSFSNVALNVGKLVFLGHLDELPEYIDIAAKDIWTNNVKKGAVGNTDDGTFLCTDLIPLYDSEGSEGDSEGTKTHYQVVWKKIKSLTTKDLEDYLDMMRPYDLIIYALQKYSEADFTTTFPWLALENSFKQINGDADIADTSTGTEDNLIFALDENKHINHVFRDLKDGQVYCFKNYVPLTVDIIPYSKVTRYERAEIINNVNKAISDNFNASKVEFGEELNYDEVKQVIEAADNRINYVRLSDFVYNTKVMVKDKDDPSGAEEYNIFDDSYEGVSFLTDLAAKNVIAGRLCFFRFDNNFKYKYGQTDCAVYTDIIQIITESKFNGDPQYGPTSEGSEGSEGPEVVGYDYDITLGKNDFIEVLYPSYYSTETYGAYVLYYYGSVNEESSTVTNFVPAGQEHILGEDEVLRVYWSDEDGNPKQRAYYKGTVIKTTFNLWPFNSDGRPTYIKDNNPYKQMASNESISIRKLVSTELTLPSNVYWVMNNNGNYLIDPGKSEKILSDGEYFVYTDSSKENLTIFGRGTRFSTLTGQSLPQGLQLSYATKISQQQLNQEGLAAKIPFVNYDFNLTPIVITEMNIITLGENDVIRMKTGADGGEINSTLQNAWDITYEVNNKDLVTLPDQGEDFYIVRSRLDINTSSNSPQELQPNQFITIWDIDGLEYEKHVRDSEDTDIIYLQSNTDMYLIGSDNKQPIDLSIYGQLGITLNWLTYKLSYLDGAQWLKTSESATNHTTGWIYDQSKGYVYLDSEIGSEGDPDTPLGPPDWVAPIKCEKITQTDSIPYTYELNNPGEIIVPMSTLWYDYLEDSEAILDREYICQLFLANQEEVEQTKNVKVKFKTREETSTGYVYTDIGIGHYGYTKDVLNPEDNTVYMLNNQSVYVYPIINSPDMQNVYLSINYDQPIAGGVLTIFDPRVTWGVNPDLGNELGVIKDRIDTLLENSSDNTIQLHWLNEPSNELALNTSDLNDPYSLFDYNNVANIITIPEVDLENSSIDIIKSMRNY